MITATTMNAPAFRRSVSSSGLPRRTGHAVPSWGLLLRYLMTPEGSGEREGYGAALAPLMELSNGEMLQKSSDHGGIHLPASIVRDLTVGSSTGGGNAVGNDPRTFIDLLREESRIFQLGATMLGDLIGDCDIPTVTMDPSGHWTAEQGAATEDGAAFGLVTMRPRTCVGWVDISRRLDKQSGLDMSTLMARAMAKGLAAAIERGSLAGAGGVSNEPLGLLNNTSGMGAVSIGTNGGPLTWDAVVDLEFGVKRAPVGGPGPAFLTTYDVRRSARKNTFSGTATSLWDRMETIAPPVASEFLPNNLTKGSGTNLSPVIYGNWVDLLVGMWGGFEVLADAFTSPHKVRLFVFAEADTAIARAASFSLLKDAT